MGAGVTVGLALGVGLDAGAGVVESEGLGAGLELDDGLPEGVGSGVETGAGASKTEPYA